VAYAHLTLAAAKSQLATLLQDPGNVFWTDAELGVYIVEALRTWGVYSFYWKERGAFATVAATPFYDLPTQLPALRGYTVTDTTLVQTLEYHLLEPPTGGAWTGTDQFDLTAVTNALQRRRNQFLVETGCRVDNFPQNVAPVSIGRTVLSDDVIDLRRLAWFDGTTYSSVEREDEWAIDAFSPSWPQNPTTPYLYSVSVAPPLTVQLAPPPSNAGQLDICAVRTQANLNPAGGVLMNVPDDFTWIIKWGALADLMGSDGQARDPQRVAYCEQRWKEGITLARLSTSAMGVRVNDVPAALVSLNEMDEYSPGWQNTSGAPTIAAMAGLNLVALADVADGAYGITMDVVRNAPVPTANGDQIQVGREELEAILSYAQHIASFKMGGEEFAITAPHYERLVKLASLKNERLLANAKDFEALMDKGQRREEAFEPRRESVTV